MELKNRMIAMFDILGFDSKISNFDQMRRVMKEMQEKIEEVRNKVYSKALPGRIAPFQINYEVSKVVFDNIILVSCDDKKNYQNFLFSIMDIFKSFAKHDLPLRGAIGFGDYIEEKDYFISNAFKEISKSEQEQDWMGCVILESAIKGGLVDNIIGKENSIKNDFSSDIFLEYDVPLKGDKKEKCVILNYGYNFQDNDRANLLKFMSAVKEKKKNTEEYFLYLDSIKDDVQILGEEFHPAKYLTTRRARNGLNIQFLDSNKMPCDPGCESFNITLLKI